MVAISLILALAATATSSPTGEAPALRAVVGDVATQLRAGHDVVHGAFVLPRLHDGAFAAAAGVLGTRAWWNADRASSGAALRRALVRADGHARRNEVRPYSRPGHDDGGNASGGGSTTDSAATITTEAARRRDRWPHLDVLRHCPPDDVAFARPGSHPGSSATSWSRWEHPGAPPLEMDGEDHAAAAGYELLLSERCILTLVTQPWLHATQVARANPAVRLATTTRVHGLGSAAFFSGVFSDVRSSVDSASSFSQEAREGGGGGRGDKGGAGQMSDAQWGLVEAGMRTMYRFPEEEDDNDDEERGRGRRTEEGERGAKKGKSQKKKTVPAIQTKTATNTKPTKGQTSTAKKKGKKTKKKKKKTKKKREMHTTRRIKRTHFPTDPTELFAEASRLADAGDPRGAAELFAYFSERYPHVIQGQTNLAAMLERDGDFEGARGAYEQAERLVETAEERADLRGRRERMDAAAAAWRANAGASGHDVDSDAGAALLRAEMAAGKGDVDMGIAALTTFLDQHGDDGEDGGDSGDGGDGNGSSEGGGRGRAAADIVRVHNTIVRYCIDVMRNGAISDARDKLEIAKVHLLKAMALDPDGIDTNANAGQIYVEGYAFDEAVGFFRKALALAPPGSDAYDRVRRQLASALGRAGPHREALDLVESVIEDNGETAEDNHLLFTLTTAMERVSPAAAASERVACRLITRDRVVRAAGGGGKGERERTFAERWEDVPDATVVTVNFTDLEPGIAPITAAGQVVLAGTRFGVRHPRVAGKGRRRGQGPGQGQGQSQSQGKRSAGVEDEDGSDIPLLFAEQAIHMVHLPGPVFSEGATGAASYTNSHALGCVHRKCGDMLASYVTGSDRMPTVSPSFPRGLVPAWPLVPLITSKPQNHYHMIAEGMTRLWVADTLYGGKVNFVVASEAGRLSEQSHELMDMFGLERSRRVAYPGNRHTRAEFSGGLTCVKTRDESLNELGATTRVLSFV